MATLSRKRTRFVQEYLIDLNATQAAIRAGYSKRTAYSLGQRLLNYVEVEAAIEVGQAEMAQRALVTADEVIAELKKLAFYNVDDFTDTDDDGKPFLNVRKMNRDQMAAISEISYDAGGRQKLKLADKRAALVDLGKHLGIFTDKVHVAGNMSHDWTVKVIAPKVDDA